MADHDQLVAEMPDVTKLSIQERLMLAKTRRKEQLKRYERQWNSISSSSSSSSRPEHLQSTERTRRGRRVQFEAKTRLFDAATRNDSSEVLSLLTTGECQPNDTNADEFTILHQCCIDGQLELIQRLVEEFGASVNKTDNELWSPLHTVALCGRKHVSKFLIDHGANLLALNIDGNMPYDICEDEDTLDVIEMEMSKRGVTQDHIEELRSTREKQMLADLKELTGHSGPDLERRGPNGETPLHVAAANGYTTVAKFLLEAKVTIDSEDNDFWQPIHCAAKWRQLPVLELLIVNGAELTPMTSEGRTPIDLCDDPEIQSWMTDLRRDVESKQSSQLTTSHQRLLEMIASKSSIQMQTSGGGNGSNSQMYSSNISLADGAKTSSSNRHLPSSEKEQMSRRSAQDEAAMNRLSLQSLVDDEEATTDASKSNKTTSQSSVNGHKLVDTVQHPTGDQLTPSLVTEDRNGNVVKTSTEISLHNGNGLRSHIDAISTDALHPKSCLRKTPSQYKTEANPNISNPRKLKILCCTIS